MSAAVVKPADTQDLESCAARHSGSNPLGGTIKKQSAVPFQVRRFRLAYAVFRILRADAADPKDLPRKDCRAPSDRAPFPAPVQTALHFKNFPYTSDAGEKDANVSGNFRRMRCTSPIWRLRMMQTSIALPSCEYMPVALTSVTP